MNVSICTSNKHILIHDADTTREELEKVVNALGSTLKEWTIYDMSYKLLQFNSPKDKVNILPLNDN